MTEHSAFSARMHRALSLIRKEARQIIRDPSSIAIGIVLPVLLILLFGYGLSLDVTDVPVAVVLEDTSPAATELAASFQLSHYFDAQLMTSMALAEQLMLGREANHARIVQAYAQTAIGQWSARRAAQGIQIVTGPVTVQNRMWFNEANE